MKIPIWLNLKVQKRIKDIVSDTFKDAPIEVEDINLFGAEYLSDNIVEGVYVKIMVDDNEGVNDNVLFGDNCGYWANRTNGHIRIDLKNRCINLNDFMSISDILPAGYNHTQTKIINPHQG